MTGAKGGMKMPFPGFWIWVWSVSRSSRSGSRPYPLLLSSDRLRPLTDWGGLAAVPATTARPSACTMPDCPGALGLKKA
jgi:hypothetical protein